MDKLLKCDSSSKMSHLILTELLKPEIPSIQKRWHGRCLSDGMEQRLMRLQRPCIPILGKEILVVIPFDEPFIEFLELTLILGMIGRRVFGFVV